MDERLPTPTRGELGTIARTAAVSWFLIRLYPGEPFTTAQIAHYLQCDWDVAKYTLEMMSLVLPLSQNPDSSWQLHER